MTREDIIELQTVTSKARALFWKLLLEGNFPSAEYAEAVFTCFKALDKATDLVSKHLAQLPLPKGGHK